MNSDNVLFYMEMFGVVMSTLYLLMQYVQIMWMLNAQKHKLL